MNRKSVRKVNNNKEKGFVLIDAIVGLALIGLIAAGFLGSIGTSYKSTMLSVEMTTSESLARSQMEYIKQQDFIAVGEGVYDEIDHPSYYDINWTVEELLDGKQKITITVNHTSEEALVVEGYKVRR